MIGIKYSKEQILNIAKALRDDSAGNSQATMTDMDFAVSMLENYAILADNGDDSKLEVVDELCKAKCENQALNAKIISIKRNLENVLKSI